MLSQLLWWASNFLVCLLLARAIRGRYLLRYGVFYVYLSWVLLDSLISFYLYVSRPWAYETYYWNAQFLSVALGYGVIWEIYTQVLADYPGVARLGRSALLAIFVLLVSKTLAQTISGQIGSPAEVPAILERDFRTVQGLLLLILVVLVAYYAIPVGRNLKGMIVGYGLFVAVSIASLALRAELGRIFQSWWQYLQPAAYDGALLTWCISLWSYQPNPRAEVGIGIERDYENLATETAKALARVRAYILRPGQS